MRAKVFFFSEIKGVKIQNALFFFFLMNYEVNLFCLLCWGINDETEQ